MDKYKGSCKNEYEARLRVGASTRARRQSTSSGMCEWECGNAGHNFEYVHVPWSQERRARVLPRYV